jgi:hypothetical protein
LKINFFFKLINLTIKISYTFLRKNPQNNICIARIGAAKLIAILTLEEAIEITCPEIKVH